MGRRSVLKNTRPLSRMIVVLIAGLMLIIAGVVSLLSNVVDAHPSSSVSATAHATPTVSAFASATKTDPWIIITPTSSATAMSSIAISQNAKPLDLTYEKIGLQHIKVGQISKGSDGSVTPPSNPNDLENTFRPYWVDDYAMPGLGSSGTTRFVGHARTDCPDVTVCPAYTVGFNRLSLDAAVGDVFTVHTETGDVSYRVIQKVTYDKHSPQEVVDTVFKRDSTRAVISTCSTDDFEGKTTAVIGEMIT